MKKIFLLSLMLTLILVSQAWAPPSVPLPTTKEYDNGTSGANLTISPLNGGKQKLTLGANTAVAFTQPATGTTATITIKIVQATGATHYTPAWTSVTWLGSGVAPTIAQTNGAVDFVTCYLDGTSTYCMASH